MRYAELALPKLFVSSGVVEGTRKSIALRSRQFSGGWEEMREVRAAR